MERDITNGLTTAEKRAVTPDWPDCECHNLPMLWQKNAGYSAGGYFNCRVKSRERRNRWRERRIDDGVCAMCGTPSDVFRCEPCADLHADSMASPVQNLKNRAAKARARQRGRASQGFQPTGVGRQLADQYLREVKHGAL